MNNPQAMRIAGKSIVGIAATTMMATAAFGATSVTVEDLNVLNGDPTGYVSDQYLSSEHAYIGPVSATYTVNGTEVTIPVLFCLNPDVVQAPITGGNVAGLLDAVSSTTPGGNYSFTLDQINLIHGLIVLGTTAAQQFNYTEFAADQYDIWKQENPSFSVTMDLTGSALDAFNAYTTNDLTAAAALPGTFSTLSPTGGQPFGFLSGAVPEPSTWALMIAGFFAVGAMMRRPNKVNVNMALGKIPGPAPMPGG